MSVTATVETVDLSVTPLRDLNQRLHDLARRPGPTHWRILHPNGAHAVACGLDAEIEVEIAPNVRVKVVRAMISEVRVKGAPVKAA